METFDGLDTIGWGMGGEGAMNYVDLPRRPTSKELETIQKRCNRVIQDNLPISVDLADNDNSKSLPEDYDKQNGVVRVIHIEGLDRNPCCGTHLSQTSHISIILLHSGHFVRKTNYRQYFTAGERAIGMSMNAINGLELTGKILGCGSSPDALVKEAERLVGLSKEMKRRERKLLMEISDEEGKKAKAKIESGSHVFLHRADGGLEFINGILSQVDESARNNGRLILVAVGTEKAGGPVVVAGETRAVEACVVGIKRILPEIKGGGAPGKWQGKVLNWDKDCFSRLQGLLEEL
ncbi:unnamed protein product [Clonostachys byssicola]|uniref:Threonyl/alanyl tRNA synthetase SAD domain-containing protein n=1 Tax=Clonostachys byssicola TaxID=160290 RepID=A0A9N9UVH2_9HYPO|nr:unnamed protein product [Clonostachys byssicola]